MAAQMVWPVDPGRGRDAKRCGARGACAAPRRHGSGSAVHRALWCRSDRARDIVHHGPANFEVPAGPEADAARASFRGTALQLVAVDDFTTVVWKKLINNVTASPLTALTRRRLEILRDDAIAELAVELAAECLAVGRPRVLRSTRRWPDQWSRGCARSIPAWDRRCSTTSSRRDRPNTRR